MSPASSVEYRFSSLLSWASRDSIASYSSGEKSRLERKSRIRSAASASSLSAEPISPAASPARRPCPPRGGTSPRPRPQAPSRWATRRKAPHRPRPGPPSASRSCAAGRAWRQRGLLACAELRRLELLIVRSSSSRRNSLSRSFMSRRSISLFVSRQASYFSRYAASSPSSPPKRRGKRGGWPRPGAPCRRSGRGYRAAARRAA